MDHLEFDKRIDRLIGLFEAAEWDGLEEPVCVYKGTARKVDENLAVFVNRARNGADVAMGGRTADIPMTVNIAAQVHNVEDAETVEQLLNFLSANVMAVLLGNMKADAPYGWGRLKNIRSVADTMRRAEMQAFEIEIWQVDLTFEVTTT